LAYLYLGNAEQFGAIQEAQSFTLPDTESPVQDKSGHYNETHDLSLLRRKTFETRDRVFREPV